MLVMEEDLCYVFRLGSAPLRICFTRHCHRLGVLSPSVEAMVKRKLHFAFFSFFVDTSQFGYWVRGMGVGSKCGSGLLRVAVADNFCNPPLTRRPDWRSFVNPLGSVDISTEPYKSGDKAEKSKITDS